MSKYGVISGPNKGKYGPEITPYLETFHALIITLPLTYQTYNAALLENIVSAIAVSKKKMKNGP